MPDTGVWELGLLRRAPHYPVLRVSKAGWFDPWPLLCRGWWSLQGASTCEANTPSLPPTPQKGTQFESQRPLTLGSYFLMALVLFCFGFSWGREHERSSRMGRSNRESWGGCVMWEVRAQGRQELPKLWMRICTRSPRSSSTKSLKGYPSFPLLLFFYTLHERESGPLDSPLEPQMLGILVQPLSQILWYVVIGCRRGCSGVCGQGAWDLTALPENGVREGETQVLHRSRCACCLYFFFCFLLTFSSFD